MSECEIDLCTFIISLFWGILAFTQKSLYYEGTDCTRYYFELERFEHDSLFEALKSLDILRKNWLKESASHVPISPIF